MCAIIFVDEHIADVCEDGIVADDARDADLFIIFIHTEDMRIGKRSLCAFTRTAFCPIGACEKIEDGFKIQYSYQS